MAVPEASLPNAMLLYRLTRSPKRGPAHAHEELFLQTGGCFGFLPVMCRVRVDQFRLDSVDSDGPRSGEDRMSLERQLGSRGRKMVKERTGQDQRTTNLFKVGGVQTA